MIHDMIRGILIIMLTLFTLLSVLATVVNENKAARYFTSGMFAILILAGAASLFEFFPKFVEVMWNR